MSSDLKVTHRLGSKNGQPNITCTLCGLTSYNYNDIKHLYCGFCHMWHTDTESIKQQTINQNSEKLCKLKQQQQKNW